jgi:hypothetical protein
MYTKDKQCSLLIAQCSVSIRGKEIAQECQASEVRETSVEQSALNHGFKAGLLMVV